MQIYRQFNNEPMLLLLYTSIYLGTHPERIQEILKYAQTKRIASKRNKFGWLSYDQQFRYRLANNPNKSWGLIDYELWLLYENPNSVASTMLRHNPNRKCFDFNLNVCLRES